MTTHGVMFYTAYMELLFSRLWGINGTTRKQKAKVAENLLVYLKNSNCNDIAYVAEDIACVEKYISQVTRRERSRRYEVTDDTMSVKGHSFCACKILTPKSIS
jgi:hypothetical protein